MKIVKWMENNHVKWDCLKNIFRGLQLGYKQNKSMENKKKNRKK